MGSSVDVVVVGGSSELLGQAMQDIAHLEQRWSRFLPDSDISRLNNAAGSPLHVDPSTIGLLQAMVAGWRATGGGFDPTLLAPLVGLGYAASWHEPAAVTSLPSGASLRGNLDELRIVAANSVVVSPIGLCLDPGGIGKGLAADLIVGRLLEAGADGASVSIGGDVCVRGAAPQPGGWLVGVADPDDDSIEVDQLAIVAGGVATSGTFRRRWKSEDGEVVHHLLDPATGRPAHHQREIVAVTVIAGTAAWAEVWTKAAMIRGAASLAALDDLGLGAHLTYADMTIEVNTAWSTYATQASSGATSLATKSM